MSSDDTYGYRNGGYGDDTGYQDRDSYGGRNSRRADREPSGPKKASVGTATAILIFAAILGFGGGAIAANSGGGEDEAPPAAGADGTESPGTDDDNSDGEDGASEDTNDAAPGEGISLSSPQDGGEVASGDSGTIEVQAVLDSPEGGVTLRVERSLDGGSSWDSFCDSCTDETTNNGSYSTNFWSGQAGANLFRVVGPDGLVSNTITVTVVAGSGEE
jgi:hypothetical protein